MTLSSTSHWTHRCPLARLNVVRWTVGMTSALLWFRVGFAALDHDATNWTLLAAVVSAQIFGTLSSGILMLRPRSGLLQRFRDWYAIVASVMTWVLGVGAIVMNEITYAQLVLLLAGVTSGLFWLLLVYFGLRPIRLGGTEHE
jgi:hypothetical protein